MQPSLNLRIIQKDGLGTLYHWKGRKWDLFIPNEEFGRTREALALDRALFNDNKRLNFGR